LPSKISRLIADESAYLVGSREDYPSDLAQLAHNRLNAVPYGTAHNTNSEGNDGNL